MPARVKSPSEIKGQLKCLKALAQTIINGLEAKPVGEAYYGALLQIYAALYVLECQCVLLEKAEAANDND